jgi:methyl-accepting chemotaxis protein
MQRRPIKGIAMLNRATISTLLKATIALCGAAVIVMLALNVWDSWNRLSSANRAAAATEASSYLFTALHNLRVDSASTYRDLIADKQQPAMEPLIRDARAGDMPALKSALAALQDVDFPDHQALMGQLADGITRLAALHAASAAAFQQPKADRPPDMADNGLKQTNELLALLDKLSTRVTISIKLEDAFVDQLMELKQLAWVVRNAGGDASVVISNTLGGRALPPDAMDQYIANVSKLNTAWAALKDLAGGLPLPPGFAQAVEKAEHDYFDPNYIELRTNTLKALVAGQPTDMTAQQWSPMSVSRLAALEGVADAALDAAKDHANDQYARALQDLVIQLCLMALAIAAVGSLILLVSRRVIKPLHKLSAAMRQLAGGDFDVVLPGLGRKDEIGEIAAATEGFKIKAAEKAQREASARAEEGRKTAEQAQREAAERAAKQAEQEREMAAERDAAMARLSGEFESAVGSIVEAAVQGDFSRRVAVEGKSGLVLNVGKSINTLCENVSKALDDLAAMLGALAEGDLTRRIDGDYQGCFATLKDNANTTAERVGTTIAEIKHAGQEVASAAAEISASTSDLSQRTEEQATSLEQTSASMEEMSVTVKKNADHAKLASQFANETQAVADRSGDVVAQAVQAMSRIDDSSRKIADIITVIDEIARQTNLLALNAAVEAARAGDAGRGFAVVAAEVRSLAQRSSQAAKDIKDLITNSSTQVKAGVELVNRTGSSLGEIVGSIKKVTEIVADIAIASAEQSTGIDQVNKALTQVDEVTQQNSALVEENAATARTLEQQAAAMNERVGAFRLDDAVAGAAARRPAMPGQAIAAARPKAAVAAKTVSASRKAVNGSGRGSALARAVNADADWKEF